MRRCSGRSRERGVSLRRALVGLAALALVACQGPTDPPTPTPSPIATATPAPTQRPTVTSTTTVEGLKYPTAMAALSEDKVLVSSREGLSVIDGEGVLTRFKIDPPGMDNVNGILDLAVPRWFDATLRFYVCYRTATDIRVVPFEANPELTGATAEPLLVGEIPLSQDAPNSCELAFGPDGALYVGTTDAGQPKAPQDLTSLGGKILRIDPMTHQPPSDNPFIDRTDPNTQLIYSYGHREVAGLAWSAKNEVMYAIDRGPGREDEVNVIVPGGNYGWNPASASTNSYQTDDVPMTDLGLPNARPAAYSSGADARGLGPAIFLQGSEWGVLDGSLAVTNTAGPRLLFLPITGEVVGAPQSLETPNPVGPTVDVLQLPDGDLLLLTAAQENSRVVRVTVV